MRLEIHTNGLNKKLVFLDTDEQYSFTECDESRSENLTTQKNISLIDALQIIYMSGKEGHPLIIIDKEKNIEKERK